MLVEVENELTDGLDSDPIKSDDLKDLWLKTAP